MYEVAVLIHILAAIAWLGAGLFIQLHAQRVRTAQGTEAVVGFLDSIEWTGTRWFPVASMGVLITGLIMVSTQDAWGFGQEWIYMALIFFVISGILGGFMGNRILKQIRQTNEEGGDLNPLLDRLSRIEWLDIIALLLIVVLMVYKPGTG